MGGVRSRPAGIEREAGERIRPCGEASTFCNCSMPATRHAVNHARQLSKIRPRTVYGVPCYIAPG